MKRAKHIDTRYHFVRCCVKGEIVEPLDVPSESNAADGFTKPLDKLKYLKFRDFIGVKCSDAEH